AHSAQTGHGGDVEDRRVLPIAPGRTLGPGRIDVGAAGEHRHRLAGANGKRLRERGWAPIAEHDAPHAGRGAAPRRASGAAWAGAPRAASTTRKSARAAAPLK